MGCRRAQSSPALRTKRKTFSFGFYSKECLMPIRNLLSVSYVDAALCGGVFAPQTWISVSDMIVPRDFVISANDKLTKRRTQRASPRGEWFPGLPNMS